MDLPEPDDRLNSWKEIAAFLGRTVRTVQRWEKTDGLPLIRGGPGHRGVVLASKRQIGEWWRRRQSQLADGGDEAVAVKDPSSIPDTPRAIRGSVVAWRPVVAVSSLVIATVLIASLAIWHRLDATPDTPLRLGRLFAAATTEGRTALSIPLGAEPSDVAVSPSANLAYVALYDAGAIAVVDLRARRVITRLDAVDRPRKLALRRDGSRLVMAGSSELGVLDVHRRALTRFSTAGPTVQDLHVSRDGRFAWITQAQAGLNVLDLDTGLMEVVPTIGCPMYLAAAPRSRRLFLSYQCGGPGGRTGHDAIEILDELQRTPIVARSGPPLVGGTIAVSPDEQHVWIDTSDACASYYDQVGCPPGSGPVLHALRADTLELLLTVRIPASTFNTRPIFFPDGTRLVLPDRGRVIDRALGTGHEAIERETAGGTFTPDGRRFITLDSGGRQLLAFEVSPPLDVQALRDAVTHWTGDGTANDVVGGTHAVAAEGVGFEPGRYGRAFSFDGTAPGVSFGRRLNVDIATSREAAYAAWIKPHRTGEVVHILSYASPSGWSWAITGDGHQSFCLGHARPEMPCETSKLVGRSLLQASHWHHVVIARRDRTLTLFIDGQEDGSIALPASFRPPNPPRNDSILRLGAGLDGSAPFDGLIDEILLFGRALSAAEVAQVMRATWLDAR